MGAAAPAPVRDGRAPANRTLSDSWFTNCKAASSAAGCRAKIPPLVRSPTYLASSPQLPRLRGYFQLSTASVTASRTAGHIGTRSADRNDRAVDPRGMASH
jgi:hypothetical protein